ncbi:alpha/beta hydrolase [Flavobacterium palustre]|uniref:Alpha/beta hydrolase n=1 Tax=Flavobacterium palustre TaxID=1476463 RepID=A0ABQ1HGV1_9FLAO|nr:alpha/beta fold hydrolase [Flavobacterium palustre]GGA76916.1 alpha/beta hydrolase [Flavobacterium palustre]
MKFSLVFIAIIASITVKAQDLTGQWNSVLKIQGTQFRLVFNVSKTDNGFSATMDSPDQKAKGIPVSKTTVENAKITFEITNAGIEYSGELKDDEIVGTFKQNGHEFPMNLSKKVIEKEILKRPQEPQKPYPYHLEEVTFQNNTAHITLAGTLTLPKKAGVFPAVILISGSGPQDRNEEIFGHKPFLIMADYLTRNGIAVLRYDDRGVGQSKGNFKTATSADFATDVESAVAYLKTRKEISKIGLIGHSEGGLIAPMVANKSNDVAFIVLLAAPGIQGDQILLLQQKLIGKASGISDADLQKNELVNRKIYDIVNKSSSLEQLNIDLAHYLKTALKDNSKSEKPATMSDDEFVKLQVSQIATPWMQYFIKYNPTPALEKVKCPVLALNGEKDVQVAANENIDAITKALAKAGNKKVTAKILPNLNHLFQECQTGAPSEYATIEQTFSPLVLEEINKWINTQTK